MLSVRRTIVMSGSETTDKSAQRPDKHEAATDEQDEDEETCPNGEAWCEGPDSDDLPCFRCFLDAQEDAQ